LQERLDKETAASFRESGKGGAPEASRMDPIRKRLQVEIGGGTFRNVKIERLGHKWSKRPRVSS